MYVDWDYEHGVTSERQKNGGNVSKCKIKQIRWEKWDAMLGIRKGTHVHGSMHACNSSTTNTHVIADKTIRGKVELYEKKTGKKITVTDVHNET